ncbi:MAG: tRNA uridine-5-carboxymethylaminomethyl(34) synthesis GTPase MnmE [candidate division Zixibacteria bacterium]|nr:tRNA uridine-5-carboxymethylaminomethyl(34) synthesis GTPase MnmE [candidate division Zixibacteria bacterium]
MLRSKRPKATTDCDGNISLDTIAAIITPPGEGGIAAVRIAGMQSLSLLRKHFQPSSHDTHKPFLMRLGRFIDREGKTIDEVMAVYMPKGKSYTGQEQVEIFCHGGRMVVELILGELLTSGARVAEPGEFTRMAFLSGRIGLTQAEAVAEIISANTEMSHKVAREHLLGEYTSAINKIRSMIVSVLAEVEASIDFTEEQVKPENNELTDTIAEIRERIDNLVKTYRNGRLLKEGFKIAIAGRPNAGKSSFFNLLLRRQRALVTSTAGTTRDYLSEWIDLDGFPVNITDTAGLRTGGSFIEKAGHESARKVISSSNLVLWMIDLSSRDWKRNLSRDIKSLKKHYTVLVGNKIDIIEKIPSMPSHLTKWNVSHVSCKTSKGLKSLKKTLLEQIRQRMPDLTSGLVVTSARHQQKLKLSLSALRSAEEQIMQDESPEIIAFTLHEAVNAIDEITGRVYNEEILGEIFSKFCIGK